jgi:hypothetical protein
MQKKMEYTVKIVTNASVDSKRLQDDIAGLGDHDIASVEVVGMRVLSQPKVTAAKS